MFITPPHPLNPRKGQMSLVCPYMVKTKIQKLLQVLNRAFVLIDCYAWSKNPGRRCPPISMRWEDSVELELATIMNFSMAILTPISLSLSHLLL